MTPPPYHAIIPRTVLERWGQSDGASPAAWTRIAPVLDQSWDEATRQGLGPNVESVLDVAALLWAGLPGIAKAVFRRCAQAALEATMLSLRQTLSCAGDAAKSAEDLPDPDGAGLAWVREGHASAIVRLGQGWALNVARDREGAARELEATARALRSWQGAPGVRVPRIGALTTGRAPWFDRRAEVPVLAAEWLEGARELHFVPTSEGPRFVRVQAFRHQPDRGPDMLGTLLDGQASTRIWKAVALARTATASIDWGRDIVTAADLEANDGDIVFASDATVGLVGASSEPWRGPIGAWPYVLALSSARDDYGGGRLRWADSEGALDAVREGFLARGTPELAKQIIEAAAKLEPERAALLAEASTDQAALDICADLRRLCQAQTGRAASGATPSRAFATRLATP